MLAVELPAAGMTEIAPTVSPLRELLQSASAGGLTITHDQTRPLPLGGTPVTWTAWSAAPESSPPQSTRTAHVYVFPFGQTPVGLSRRHNATAGNHAAKVVRDSAGHVHVVWLDADRPGTVAGVFYRRGAQDPVTGAHTWETPPIRISHDRTPATFTGLEASPGALHVAWYSRDHAWYRRIVRSAGEWKLDPIRDTGALGEVWDNGPDIAARSDDEVHVLTYSGQYAVSTNAGGRWRVEQVPWPRGEKKNPALAVDAAGNAHVVFTLKVRTPERGFSGGRPSGGYWQLRYVRRQAQGGWGDAQDVLAAFPEWSDRGPTWDTLADWADIAVDARGTLHVGWHGTAHTGIYGRDEPFYLSRPSVAPGVWGAWQTPQALHPVNRAAGHSFSFAPSLSLDPAGAAVFAVVFFELQDLPREIFDSDALLLRGGKLVGEPLPLSRAARTALDAGRPRDALSTWFPAAAPRLFRAADGRVWLDVLHTAETPERLRTPHFVIYQRREVTSLLGSAAR
jgi:hypothetical protein